MVYSFALSDYFFGLALTEKKSYDHWQPPTPIGITASPMGKESRIGCVF
jgi:hypothetical protein